MPPKRKLAVKLSKVTHPDDFIAITMAFLGIPYIVNYLSDQVDLFGEESQSYSNTYPLTINKDRITVFRQAPDGSGHYYSRAKEGTRSGNPRWRDFESYTLEYQKPWTHGLCMVFASMITTKANVTQLLVRGELVNNADKALAWAAAKIDMMPNETWTIDASQFGYPIEASIPDIVTALHKLRTTPTLLNAIANATFVIN